MTMSSNQEAGAKGRLVISSPFGKDGNSLFSSNDGILIWTPEFDSFLMELGMVEDIKK